MPALPGNHPAQWLRANLNFFARPGTAPPAITGALAHSLGLFSDYTALGRARSGGGNFETLDLFLDLVDEIGRAGAVHDAMIEGQRKRDHFRCLLLSFRRRKFVVRGADEQACRLMAAPRSAPRLAHRTRRDC